MSTTVIALGSFRFEVRANALTMFERLLPARHEEVAVIGRRPSLHFAGPDVETVRLTALCYPAFLGGRGLEQIEEMRQATLAGAPLMLAAASGQVLGRWVIASIGDVREKWLPGGAQRVELEIELKRYAGNEQSLVSGRLRLFA